MEISLAASHAITNHPSCSMLQEISKLVNNGLSAFEPILEQKNPTQLLEYLESSNRLDESLALIK